MAATIIIGLTTSDRDNNYIPSMDGYREGAEQVAVTVDLPDALLAGVAGKDVAEACFIATNAPAEVLAFYPLADEIADRLFDVRRNVRSVSVGDTITVGGERYECGSVGWKQMV